MPNTEIVFPDVKTARILTALEFYQHCPAEPGIYAAWIKDRAGLAAAGIDGPLPRLMYVGISKRTNGGLQTRLDRHVHVDFQAMNELLAVRGVVLGDWGDRSPEQRGGMAHTTALIELAGRQTLAWQHQYFRWAWQTCSPALARASELEAIRHRKPMLNVRHMTDGLPQQLRAGARYERARARWLWHASWAALLIGDSSRFDKDRWREKPRPDERRIAVDSLGFPMPLDEATSARQIRTVRMPELDEVWQVMLTAAAGAPLSVRHAVAQGPDDYELEAWWAAHAGAPYLPKPVSVQTSIAQSLKLATEEQTACPERLPDKDRVRELSMMLPMLGAVAH